MSEVSETNIERERADRRLHSAVSQRDVTYPPRHYERIVSSAEWSALNADVGSRQDVLVVQQDAAVVIEYEHVVAAPGDGPVGDGDHVPCQPDESGCQEQGIAIVSRLECVFAGLDEQFVRPGHQTIA